MLVSRRRPLRWLLSFVLGLAFITLAYFMLLEPLAVAACQQLGPEWLNHLVAKDADRSVANYLSVGRLFLSRFLVLYFVGFGAAAAWSFRRPLRNRMTAFAKEPGSPINLAVFRIAVFAVLYLKTEPKSVELFASFPAELRKLPHLGGIVLRLLPFDPEIAHGVAYALKAVCVFGMFGLASRSSALIAALLAFYVLGLQQSYGNVSHYHHLIWFALLLAVSRCGDALSLDALLASRPGNWKSRLLGPSPAVIYGVPLRFVWLLFGVIYFFPGFWKFWNCGYAWGLSDNLRLQLYHEWARLGDWRPIFRIDEYPMLLTLGGMSTLVFEMGFVFSIFSSRTRLWGTAAGLVFHNMANMFLTISFWYLQWLYVAFVPWDRLLKHRGNSKALPAAVSSLPRRLVWLGIGLLVVNIGLGATHQTQCWPCACYPTFAYSLGEERREIQLCRVEPDGGERSIPIAEVRQSIQDNRWDGLVGVALSDNPPQQEKIEALGWVLSRILDKKDFPLRLYEVHRSVLLDQPAGLATQKRLLYEFPLQQEPPELASSPQLDRNRK
jgi:hypothetical protein